MSLFFFLTLTMNFRSFRIFHWPSLMILCLPWTYKACRISFSCIKWVCACVCVFFFTKRNCWITIINSCKIQSRCGYILLNHAVTVCVVHPFLNGEIRVIFRKSSVSLKYRIRYKLYSLFLSILLFHSRNHTTQHPPFPTKCRKSGSTTLFSINYLKYVQCAEIENNVYYAIKCEMEPHQWYSNKLI